MERTEQNEGGYEGSFGTSGGGGSEIESGAASGRWSSGSQTRNVFGQLKDRAEDGWGWARRNPWPVVGAAIGIGLLLAWRRRGDASHRLAQMNADHPVGRPGQGARQTDEVSEGMAQASP